MADGAPVSSTFWVHALKCPHCSFLTLETSRLQQHLHSNHPGSEKCFQLLMCPRCAACTTEKVLLEEHLRIFHKEIPPTKVTESDTCHQSTQTDDCYSVFSVKKLELKSPGSETGISHTLLQTTSSSHSHRGDGRGSCKYKRYSATALQTAFRKVLEGKMSIHRAAIVYEVPDATLRDRFRARKSERPRRERPHTSSLSSDSAASQQKPDTMDVMNLSMNASLLSTSEQTMIADHIRVMSDNSTPYSSCHLASVVEALALATGRPELGPQSQTLAHCLLSRAKSLGLVDRLAYQVTRPPSVAACAYCGEKFDDLCEMWSHVIQVHQAIKTEPNCTPPSENEYFANLRDDDPADYDDCGDDDDLQNSNVSTDNPTN